MFFVLSSGADTEDDDRDAHRYALNMERSRSPMRLRAGGPSLTAKEEA